MKPYITCFATAVAFLFSGSIVAMPFSDTLYRIALCADVPDNNHPGKVFYKGEPGHVFIVLERVDSSTFFRECYVWGFYPKKAISCILFRKVKSRLVDNSNKEYDVSITRFLQKTEYEQLLHKALELSKKKYHLNNYNCYHYALELFNSLQMEQPLPLSRVKFPFLFGRGGSPCALYRDLQSLHIADSDNTFNIRFNRAKAPVAADGNNPTVKASH